MTARNAILLIIKQNPGIEYNSLLNKIASNYSNINSARAALSRTMKDLKIFGYVRLDNHNRLFTTDKTTALINSEMKNKLLLKLNQLVNSKNNYLEIDKIIEYLHTLIERSKEDADLLKVARGSTDFYIADLADLNARIHKQISHLSYITNILQGQVESLEALDFNNLQILDFDKSSKKKITLVAAKLDAKEVSLDANNKEFIDAAAALPQTKLKGNTVFFSHKELPEILDFVSNATSKNSNLVVMLYLPVINVKIREGKAYISGSHKKLLELWPLAQSSS